MHLYSYYPSHNIQQQASFSHANLSVELILFIYSYKYAKYFSKKDVTSRETTKTQLFLWTDTRYYNSFNVVRRRPQLLNLFLAPSASCGDTSLA
jgi:hypothetical protein